MNLNDVVYIPGIEISSILDGKYKMHILGYGIDPDNEEIQYVVEYLKNARRKRIYEIADFLREKYNIKLYSNELDELIEHNPIPGKVHIAQLLIQKGYGQSISEIFKKYLAKTPTKTSNRIDAKIAIKAIQAAGAYAIWAHPKKVETEYSINFQDLMPKLLELGIDGIEVGNYLHSYDDYKRYLNYAHENNLITSAGSDYHGPSIKPNVRMGMLYHSDENIKIDISTMTILEKDFSQYKNNKF